MEIQVNYEYRADEVQELLDVRRLVELILTEEGMPAATEVSVSFVDDAEIHRLNREYRDIDRPTDVLSFECDGVDDDFGEANASSRDEPFELGDVVVAVDVAKRQAPQYAMTYPDEMSLLVTHGMLHLCGYDHLENEEAERMEEREVELLTLFWNRPFKRHGLDS